VRRVVPFLVLAALLAGCGARNSKPFTAKGTIPCLRKKGFAVTTAPSKIGFIAAFAENGGLRATPRDGNALTIAFTKDTTTVGDTEKAFRDHASPTLRPHIADVMSASRNAVLVWTTTPSDADRSAAEGCLAP
jgi:hypothetical protein